MTSSNFSQRKYLKERNREYSKMSMTALYKTDHVRKESAASISMYSPPHIRPLSQSERVMSESKGDPGDHPKKRTQSDGAGTPGMSRRKKESNVTISAFDHSVNEASYVPTIHKYDDAAKMFSMESDYSDEDFAPDVMDV